MFNRNLFFYQLPIVGKKDYAVNQSLTCIYQMQQEKVLGKSVGKNKKVGRQTSNMPATNQNQFAIEQCNQ